MNNVLLICCFYSKLMSCDYNDQSNLMSCYIHLFLSTCYFPGNLTAYCRGRSFIIADI